MPYYKSCIHAHTHTNACGYRISKCNIATPYRRSVTAIPPSNKHHFDPTRYKQNRNLPIMRNGFSIYAKELQMVGTRRGVFLYFIANGHTATAKKKTGKHKNREENIVCKRCTIPLKH